MGVGFAEGDLDDARGDGLEKISVVCDEHHSAGKASQKILEPPGGFGVEMVGRLVEEQQIGLRGKGAAERDAAFLASRKWSDHGIERRRVESPGEAFDAGLEVPAVGVLDFFEAFLEFGITPLAGLVAAHPLHEIGGSILNILENCGLGIEFEFLREIADAETATTRDVAGIGGIFAGEDFEEARLAAAVATDESDLFAWSDSE